MSFFSSNDFCYSCYCCFVIIVILPHDVLRFAFLRSNVRVNERVLSFANYFARFIYIYTVYSDYSDYSFLFTWFELSIRENEFCLLTYLFTCLLLLPITTLNTNKDSYIVCASINLKLLCLRNHVNKYGREPISMESKTKSQS